MTTQDDASSIRTAFQDLSRDAPSDISQGTLRDEVHRSLARYFQQLEEQPVSDLYEMVISEVEAPLFDVVMRYADNNQSKASIMLGLNRGTLRKKLKQYGLL